MQTPNITRSKIQIIEMIAEKASTTTACLNSNVMSQLHCNFSAHEITERAKLLQHQIYAVTVEATPTLITEAIAMLEKNIASDGGYAGDRLWLDLLKTRPWAEVHAQAIADTEDGRTLRSSNPFARLIGVKNPETRRALWRLAKIQLMHEVAPSDCDTSRNEGQAPA